jgi:xylulokinase
VPEIQPNNAFSLNVLQPGEIAATAGTSGVVYGVTDLIKFDPLSRVNTFIHVNHEKDNPRLGVLLCINGTGILNSWMQKTVAPDLNYDAINLLASAIPAGSEGLTILPFGNGSERMLDNRDIGGSFSGLNFNIHGRGHLLRAAQEGIAFSIYHGMKIMEEVGITISVIRAGKANLFLSPVFRQTLADISGATIQLYDTDGALGAARGAALGAGIYSSFTEAFTGLNALDTVEPEKNQSHLLNEAYQQWKDKLMAATGQR